jgi:hypothetical protein
MKEIRQMRLPKAGLPGQQGDAERAPLYPAQQFQAESLVHLRNVHLWKIHHQQWARLVPVCFQKTEKG